MVSAAMVVRDMLNTLEEEDCKMAISYIQFLSDSRKKERVKKASDLMDKFQTVIGEDKGWDSEEAMLEEQIQEGTHGLMKIVFSVSMLDEFLENEKL